MSSFYLDSSALVKRYMREIGTPWMTSLLEPHAGHVILISEITRVEVAAALSARHRSGAISQSERDQAISLLLYHAVNEYHALPTAAVILDRAIRLTQVTVHTWGEKPGSAGVPPAPERARCPRSQETSTYF